MVMDAPSPDAIRAETITITGRGGDEIEAYRPEATAITRAIAHAPAGLAAKDQ
ncbi:hypothetical protein PICSAR240_03690 [Mycobacterium avium subsp. paratuberculosis]|nr:hypothetical protein D522_07024 [Mycobacterium avium subsp. paratuberculosis S5]ETA91766.1 hypothetical protein O984_15340 [Mycobacterium avium 05-4293]ETA99558.1 hypothetical protein O982_06175 [Mycobacterium avium 10-5581]ETB02398.1 hypothetical protein O979_11455 [Mycobacterium avium subsp. paratuberculosis 10-4404]ETB02501.1 hypothetical protein O978_15435 [Mycobacterium avium subsp. paratuberculosis 10-5864]ETB10544.1 hypothetical protein O980_15135 [Mycobacterium avium subsp. paratube